MFADYLAERGINRVPGAEADPWVVGHRGYSGIAPENTLAAFDAARNAGVDFIEVDLWVSADGTPVVIHDGTMARTTGWSGHVGKLTDERISLADAGSWMGPGFAGQRIPTFAGLLQLVRAGGGNLLVELKGDWSAGAVARVSQEIMDFGMADRIILQSFSIVSVRAARDLIPMVPRALLIDSRHNSYVDQADELEVMAINPSVNYANKNRDKVESFLASGLGVFVYTANEPAEWVELLDVGATGIITDFPGRLQGFLAARRLAGLSR